MFLYILLSIYVAYHDRQFAICIRYNDYYKNRKFKMPILEKNAYFFDFVQKVHIFVLLYSICCKLKSRNVYYYITYLL